MQRASAQPVVRQPRQLSKELDTLLFGLGMDSDAKSIYLDVETRAVEGSDLAKQSNALANAKTNFAGFAIPNAAMTLLSSSTTDAEQAAQAKKTLDQLKDSAAKLLDQERRPEPRAARTWPSNC